MKKRLHSVLALLGAATIVGGCVLLVQIIRDSRDPAGTATLVQGVLAPVAIAVTLLGALGTWWFSGRRPHERVEVASKLEAAAEQLRHQMKTTWRAEARARGIELPAPATIRWQWAPEQIAAPPDQIRCPPPPGLGPPPLPGSRTGSHQPRALLASGVVTSLHEDLYLRLPYGRLVILGPAGAGKTAAMILLLLAALDHQSTLSVEDGARARLVPVPVWLTLSGWDPGSTSLLDWARAVMVRDHQFLLAPEYGPDVAGFLLTAGRVSLFLDGLDEMPPALHAAALRRLDEETSHIRMVMTSRPEEYRRALIEGRWHNAAVVELLPPSPQDAADYLTRDQVHHAPAWRQVAEHLTAHPDSVGTLTLTTPLALSLARAVYRDRDPSELVDPARFTSVPQLRRHLLAQFIVTAYPDPRHRAQATLWLAWIAHHMAPSTTLRWWQIPTWISRRRRSTVVAVPLGLATGVLVGLATGVSVMRPVPFDRPGVLSVVVTTAVVTVAAGSVYAVLAARWAGRRNGYGMHEPQSLTVRRPTADDLPFIRRSALGALLPAVTASTLLLLRADLPAVMSTTGLLNGLIFGCSAGTGATLTVGLLQLWRTPVSDTPAATTGGSHRSAVRATYVGTTVCTLAAGLTAAVASALAVDQRHGLPAGLVSAVIAGAVARLAIRGTFGSSAAITIGLASTFSAGLTFGLASSVAAVLAAAVTSGLAYAIAAGPLVSLRAGEAVLRVQGRPHIRFNALLQDALERQVLRQTGALYQFRHAELQDHLAAVHHDRGRWVR